MLRRDHQAVPTVDHNVLHERKLRFLSKILAIEPCLRIRCGLVRVVAPFLTVEVHHRIDWVSRTMIRAALLILKALLPSPGFYQRPVDRNVFVAQKIIHARLLKHFRQKCAGDVSFSEFWIPISAFRIRTPRLQDLPLMARRSCGGSFISLKY